MSRYDTQIAKLQKHYRVGEDGAASGPMPSAADVALANLLQSRATAIWLDETIAGFNGEACATTDDDRAFLASDAPDEGGAWAAAVLARAHPVTARGSAVIDAWLAEISQYKIIPASGADSEPAP